ncbi:MAG: transposase [Acidimicrobiales bacterium]
MDFATARRVPEVRRLGKTLSSWRSEIVAHHATGASAGPTEALNLLVKKVKRVGHGHRSFAHYRLRLLLHCGVTWAAPVAATLRPLERDAVHRDSIGNEQLIVPGELNLMTAGHGVAHPKKAPATWRAARDAAVGGPAGGLAGVTLPPGATASSWGLTSSFDPEARRCPCAPTSSTHWWCAPVP